jgi:23S rRNA (uracil1939-C5)-methyltransferase
MMKKNSIVEFKVEKINRDFEGISTIDGFKIVTPEVLPGEKVEGRVVKLGKEIAFVKGDKILERSEDRADIHDDLLPLSYIKYPQLLNYKKDHFIEEFGSEIEIEHSTKESFRNKIFFPLDIIKGKLECGLYIPRSHQISPYNFDSKAFSPEVNRLLKEVMILLNRVPKAVKEQFKGIFLRGEDRSYQLGLQIDGKVDNERIGKLLEKLELLTSLFIYQKDSGNSVLVKDPIFLFGNEYCELEISGEIYQLRPESFFQLNSYITEKIIADIVHYFKDIELDTIHDFYAGCGVLSNYFSNYNKRVLYEKSVHSYKYISDPKTELITTDLQKSDIEATEGSLFIFDPPRKGIGTYCVEMIKRSKPDYIIYLSCNYISQKKDIEPLLESYSIDYIKGYDMFPYTPHLEVLAILKRR